MSPEGELLPPGQHDALLAVGRSPRAETHLGSVLVPCPDRLDGLPESLVLQVLEHVGLGAGSGSVWVDLEGRWQAGPLHGSWEKPTAEHLGESAREARRRRRLAELEADVQALEARLEELAGQREALEARMRTARREADRAPAEAPLHQARARAEQCDLAVHRARARVVEAEKKAGECRVRLDGAEGERREKAADLGLSDWLEDPAGLSDLLSHCREALAALWPTLRSLREAREAATSAEARAREARRQAEAREALARSAEEAAREAVATRDVLEETQGATVREVQERLSRARGREAGLEQRLEELRRGQVKAEVAVASAEGRIGEAERDLDREVRARQEAVDLLAAFVETRLLGVAVPDLASEEPANWSVSRAVEVARRAEAALGTVGADDAAWARGQKEIHGHFQRLQESLLAQDYHPEAEMHPQGLLVVSVPFQGRTCTVAELRDALADEVASRQALLSARERDLLENHLIGEVAAHLHARLRDAQRLVREMNDELERRPTSTGMALRFAWDPAEEGPAGLADAHRRLMRADSTWTPQDREALGRFLQQQIHSVRARNEAGTWLEHLQEALDYRAWHRFSVERRQDGQWKRLTRRTHGTGSGGEKALALTMPQFAAAAAHYKAAHPSAPRLILMDEAFVGIDRDMRGKCMELLRVFDLDFAMTSEHEWGCYAALPGLAIYQLATRPDVDAVLVTRWVWNGQERVRADVPAPPVREEAEAPPPTHGEAEAAW